MRQIETLNLILFFIAQIVGITILVSGSPAGLIAIIMSIGSGYVGISALIKEFSPK